MKNPVDYVVDSECGCEISPVKIVKCIAERSECEEYPLGYSIIFNILYIIITVLILHRQ